MHTKAIIKETLRDRGFVLSVIATALVLLAVIVLCIVNIRPNELQVPIRNTVFGVRYTYQEQWYNELAFLGFALLVAVLHTGISVKLYTLKDRRYAIGFQWMTALILGVSFLVFVAIFKVISVVQ